MALNGMLFVSMHQFELMAVANVGTRHHGMHNLALLYRGVFSPFGLGSCVLASTLHGRVSGG